ncbi:hypothetical protein ACGF0D_10745 [Kitasatospora sp. NPDC048298]|uniref:hypothetical protein n=1 Tax=Kitasatospora sp. NPDC048298 TaxID=3364049 RepID=UPI0037127DCE
MKTCKHCGKEKELRDFRKDAKAASGRGATCNRCTANREQQRYHQNGGREKRRSRRKELASERRAQIEKLKDVPCADCGHRFPPVCMDFDHVSGEKLDSVSEMFHRARSWEAIEMEIAKCEVVCSNCHRIRTATRGQWYSYLDREAV